VQPYSTFLYVGSIWIVLMRLVAANNVSFHDVQPPLDDAKTQRSSVNHVLSIIVARPCRCQVGVVRSIGIVDDSHVGIVCLGKGSNVPTVVNAVGKQNLGCAVKAIKVPHAIETSWLWVDLKAALTMLCQP
jgi:hypothetical protein